MEYNLKNHNTRYVSSWELFPLNKHPMAAVNSLYKPYGICKQASYGSSELSFINREISNSILC